MSCQRTHLPLTAHSCCSTDNLVNLSHFPSGVPVPNGSRHPWISHTQANHRHRTSTVTSISYAEGRDTGGPPIGEGLQLTAVLSRPFRFVDTALSLIPYYSQND